ncbi:MAG: hypothetical protein Q9191_003258 [Dirinaria sp. TL-2023a]
MPVSNPEALDSAAFTAFFAIRFTKDVASVILIGEIASGPQAELSAASRLGVNALLVNVIKDYKKNGWHKAEKEYQSRESNRIFKF